MSEGLTSLTTDENVEQDIDIIIEDDIEIEDLDANLEIEETVEIVEVEPIEEIDIEMDESIGWVGGDNTRHYSLYGRDEADQHPITAITGLREELNDIEALDVVYSDERNQANYYLWQDENILQENRVGYFVSACSDINEIEICTSDNDIFGVTVDGAGFIGAQSDVARDIKYGLVVTTGIVHVRCESSVNVGDYVISNDYGCAKKNKNGYKVVGRHQIDGVEYAEITLTTPINRICKLSDEVEDVSQRMDDAETNIVAAINVANAAYNKAGEATSVSEEAVKNALEALNKSNETSERTDDIETNLSSANEVAVQAKAIAESAAVSAEAIRNEAVNTANDALANVNNLIKDLEPIITWEDVESGNTGAEYFTTYIKEGLATKVEVQTVETMTNDNKTAIEKNADGIQTLVSSVDKYSVGEYSQSYGLTHEQAKSVLKEGMIYVPTKHSDTRSHSETFEDTQEINDFTPGSYYMWDGNDWIEYGNTVAFFSEELTPNNTLQYWYVDSNEAPDGYEAHALYINENGQWTKVNILDGNVNNRISSMIRQKVDGVALEVTNARGSAATLGARITNTEAIVENTAQWTKGKTEDGEELYNIATIKQMSSGDGSSLALVVADAEGNKILKGASIVLGQNEENSYIKLDADNIHLEGYTTINKSFAIDEEGYMTASGGTIGGWSIDQNGLSKSSTDPDDNPFYFFLQSNPYSAEQGIPYNPVIAVNYQDDYKFYVRSNGHLYAKDAEIEGKITASDGTIGGWQIDGEHIFNYNEATGYTFNLWNPSIATGHIISCSSETDCPFFVDRTGHLHVTSADIVGELRAGSIIGDINKMGGSFALNVVYDEGYSNLYDTDVCRLELKSQELTYQGTTRNTMLRLTPHTIALLGFANGRIGGAVTVGDDGGELEGTWRYGSGEVITSDCNLKHDIELLSEQYSVFFDALKPKRFKYNDGTSDRYHIGFIAQEVYDAFTDAGLDSQEVGAYVHFDKSVDKEARLGLRYGEFIALNTLQIQRAQARIRELEEKIAELNALIKGE